MQIKELDVVELKDGREGTILQVYDAGKYFLIEIADDKGITIELPTISIDDIQKITYTFKPLT